MIYHIDITDLGDGRFKATYRDSPVEVTSSNPEEEICDRMMRLEFPDAPVQFWRDGIRTLSHSSIRKMAKAYRERVRRANFKSERPHGPQALGARDRLEPSGAQSN